MYGVVDPPQQWAECQGMVLPRGLRASVHDRGQDGKWQLEQVSLGWGSSLLLCPLHNLHPCCCL